MPLTAAWREFLGSESVPDPPSLDLGVSALGGRVASARRFQQRGFEGFDLVVIWSDDGSRKLLARHWWESDAIRDCLLRGEGFWRDGLREGRLFVVAGAASKHRRGAPGGAGHVEVALWLYERFQREGLPSHPQGQHIINQCADKFADIYAKEELRIDVPNDSTIRELIAFVVAKLKRL